MVRRYDRPSIGYGSLPFGHIKRRTLNFTLPSIKPTFNQGSLEPTTTFNFSTGGTMKIRFDRYEETMTNPNAKGKTFAIVRVHGEALDGKKAGQPWSTQVFANNKEVAGQIKGLTPGSTVNVTMTKNGNFWNATKFEMDAEVVGAAATPNTAPAMLGGGVPTPVVAPVENQRFKNLEMAVAILGDKPAKKDGFEYLTDAAGLAEMVQDYLDKKGAFQFDNNTSTGIPELDDDEEESSY